MAHVAVAERERMLLRSTAARFGSCSAWASSVSARRSSDRRRISKSRPSSAGGKGLRSRSQRSWKSVGASALPSSTGSDLAGSRHGLPGTPSTAGEPSAKASSRSYAATGCQLHWRGRYTIKRYESEKAGTEDAWQHTRATLRPTNPAFEPIVLDTASEGTVQVVAKLLEVGV